MHVYIDSTQAVAEWIASLGQEGTVYFPQPEDDAGFGFLPVTTTAQIQFDHYLPTIVPPVKRLLPDREVMFHYQRMDDGRIEFAAPAPVSRTTVLAGVRACDLKGIALMDAAFGDAPADPLYLQRRAEVTLIGVSCLKPCSDRCFCAATGALDWRQGADVWITPTDAGLAVEPLSTRGGELLAKSRLAADSSAVQRRQDAESSRPNPFGRQLDLAVEQLPEVLQAGYESPVYADYAARCFSCGTCNLVCPTCYCFDVTDEPALDRRSGQRTRSWDSCMNGRFAEVTGGHNFRDDAAKRQRHRIKRKFDYLNGRFGMGSFCVGCGRCGTQCTTGIDIFDMVNDLVRASGGAA